MNKLFAILVVILAACNPVKHLSSVEEEMRMYDVISSYTRVYAKAPRNIQDIIVYIERCGTETEDMYGVQYTFLKRYQNRLIIESTASTITIYDRYIDKHRLVISVSNESEYAYKTGPYNFVFFDADGYYIISEEAKRLLNKDLHALYIKYADLFNNTNHERVMMKSTSDELANLSHNVPIFWWKSEYYTDVFRLLEEYRKRYSFSAIILPIYAVPFDEITNCK